MNNDWINRSLEPAFWHKVMACFANPDPKELAGLSGEAHAIASMNPCKFASDRWNWVGAMLWYMALECN